MDADAARLATSPATLCAPAAHAALRRRRRARAGTASCATRAPIRTSWPPRMTQSRLRAAAVSKFGPFATGMLFTQDGLEQATRLAGRRPPRAALPRRRRAVGGGPHVRPRRRRHGVRVAGPVAFSPSRATRRPRLLADHNLRHWDEARVVHADAMDTLGRGQPSTRRPSSRTPRGATVAAGGTTLATTRRLSTTSWPCARRGRDMGIKVGPALPPRAPCRPTPRHSGSAWTATWWRWACGRAGSRDTTAIRRSCLRGGESHRLRRRTRARARRARWATTCYEPDGAVIRAGLVGPLAESVGATPDRPSHRVPHVRRSAHDTLRHDSASSSPCRIPRSAWPPRWRRGASASLRSRSAGWTSTPPCSGPAQAQGRRERHGHPHARRTAPASAIIARTRGIAERLARQERHAAPACARHPRDRPLAVSAAPAPASTSAKPASASCERP